MTVTLTWQTILFPILVIAGIACLVFLCVVFANLITTLKKLNTVLDDAKEVTEFVTDQKNKANSIIGGMENSISQVASNLKANKNIIKNVSSVVGATTSIIGVAKATGKKRAAKVAKAEKKAEKKAKKETK